MNARPELEAAMVRVEETLQTARQGLQDLLEPSKTRRLTGLRNLIAFGRSVTFVLQNLRSLVPKFDEWYAPHQEKMRSDPLMRYFILARNELEKQGKLSVVTSAHLHSFSLQQIQDAGPPPPNAESFFIGDRLGGSGWRVRMPDGAIERYYVNLPAESVTVTQHFDNLPENLPEELQGATIEVLSQMYIERLSDLVATARRDLISTATGTEPQRSGPNATHLRRVK